MRSGRRATAMFVMATSVFVSPIRADVPLVNPAPCIAPAMNARVSAAIPSNLTSPRVFFRANGQGPEYYLDMHRGPNGSWWAMLPAIVSSTKSIAYRVGGLDGTKHWVLSNPISLPAGAACPSQTLTPDEQLAVQHLVLGLTAYNQAAAPAGFSCRGVTNVIASNGQMGRAEECRAAAFVPVTPATTPAATAAATAANTAAKSIALKAAALAAGGFAAGYAIGHGNENRQLISPSH
jgi:hypothetical protein